MSTSAPKSAAMRALYWRSEILGVVHWLHGEGLGDVVDTALIRQYLGLDSAEELCGYLDRLVEEGALVRDGEWFALSARSRALDEVKMATAFTDLVRPVVGECADDCWCQTSAVEAQACSSQRSWGARLGRDDEPGKALA